MKVPPSTAVFLFSAMAAGLPPRLRVFLALTSLVPSTPAALTAASRPTATSAAAFV
jgi:hypothetical protein